MTPRRSDRHRHASPPPRPNSPCPSLLTPRAATWQVEHEPTATRERNELRSQLASRRAELRQLEAHDAELATSEATLSQRLWEVQETRRRQKAMHAQLSEAVAELERELAT